MHVIPCNMQFDLWAMKYGIAPTLSSGIDRISDYHINALLLELNWIIRVDAKKSYILVAANLDASSNIQIYFTDYNTEM